MSEASSTTSSASPAGAETRRFEAEVSRLLEIVTHSLYSNRDIFLRELVANAADACEKRRYLAVADASLAPAEGFAITLAAQPKGGQLVIADNGIGMTRDELIANLGTIAASGTQRFLQALKDKAAQGKEAAGKDAAGGKPELTQIGQFGVGFYSAFMVASEVTVETRRAGSAEGWAWRSTGGESYSLEPLDPAPPEPGTRVTLTLKPDAKEYLDKTRLEQLVKSWCDHLSVPIRLEGGETLNRASALWTRPRSEVTAEQYEAFYRDVAQAFDKPWRTLHYRAEGAIEYTALLFVPAERPFALFHPDRRADLRLHVKRVFISADVKELLPSWLRFLKGVIDSEDLPLNVSRELLQANPLLAKIRAGVIKRVLADLRKAADEDAEGYGRFWENFGAVLKEGLYEDPANREALLGLARFRSSAVEGWTTLKDYVARMKEGQAAIYTAAGESPARLAKSPQLEGFRARGLEVLYLTDPVDEFWVPGVAAFEGKPFRSVTRGQADLAAFPLPADKAPPPAGEIGGLVALLRLTLGEAVKEVRSSERLAESAVCLVAGEGDLDLNLERLMKAHGQVEKASARVLELNPRHALIQGLARRLKEQGGGPELEDAAWLLLDQARLAEGEAPADPAAFAQRLQRVLQRGLGPAAT